MRKSAIALAFVLLGLAACQPVTPASLLPTATSPQAAPFPLGPKTPAAMGRCGDGECERPENPANCPADCPSEATPSPMAPPISDVYPADTNTYWVTNPTTGARLYVELVTPRDWDGKTALPALILIPGGNGSSRDFKKPGGKHAQRLADEGYLVVLFDPDGRGKSAGVEDQNGYAQQDGLAEVIWFAFRLPTIQRPHIGLVSFSYGITMAAGAMARYPDLPIRFLIDWEGPANRNDTGGCDQHQTGHLKGVVSCDDEAFWAQREASAFIGKLRIPYLRLQSEKDHAQPDTEHALVMVNAAVQGGVPWVRLNDLPPNQTYDLAQPPPMLSESETRDLIALVGKYATEMLLRHGGE